MSDPTKIGFFGPMKKLGSARVETHELPKHRISITIHHSPMRAVNVRMMRWWFENLDSRTTLTPTGVAGAPVPVYRLWHPYDHVRVDWLKKIPGATGGPGPGSVLQVQEDLGGLHFSRSSVRVTKLDESAFNFELGNGRSSVGQMEHRYRDGTDGLLMETEMRFGVESPLLWRFLNPLLRQKAFTPALASAWILHNVEECGETEKFLPEVYAHELNNRNSPASTHG